MLTREDLVSWNSCRVERWELTVYIRELAKHNRDVVDNIYENLDKSIKGQQQQ